MANGEHQSRATVVQIIDALRRVCPVNIKQRKELTAKHTICSLLLSLSLLLAFRPDWLVSLLGNQFDLIVDVIAQDYIFQR